jgi:hypothetical protein
MKNLKRIFIISFVLSSCWHQHPITGRWKVPLRFRVKSAANLTAEYLLINDQVNHYQPRQRDVRQMTNVAVSEHSLVDDLRSAPIRLPARLSEVAVLGALELLITPILGGGG